MAVVDLAFVALVVFGMGAVVVAEAEIAAVVGTVAVAEAGVDTEAVVVVVVVEPELAVIDTCKYRYRCIRGRNNYHSVFFSLPWSSFFPVTRAVK